MWDPSKCEGSGEVVRCLDTSFYTPFKRDAMPAIRMEMLSSGNVSIESERYPQVPAQVLGVA